MRLPDDYIAECERRARRYQGQWTGTAGAMAADSMRLQLERRELLKTIDELEQVNAALQAAAVEPATRKVPLDPREAGVPQEFLDKHPNMTYRPATPQPEATFAMQQVGASLTPEQLEAVWATYREKQAALHARIRGEVPSEPISVEKIPLRRAVPSAPAIIGLTGPAGCGKTTVAGMIEGAVVIQLADPLYAALALMLGVDEAILRHRGAKERPLPGFDRSPRQLLQTLGTDWGRAFVGPDVWLRMAGRRIDALHAAGAPTVVLADVRFENEAEWIRNRGGEVWRVEREPTAAAAAHVSEAGIPDALINRTIDNTGAPDNTRQMVAAALRRE